MLLSLVLIFPSYDADVDNIVESPITMPQLIDVTRRRKQEEGFGKIYFLYTSCCRDALLVASFKQEGRRRDSRIRKYTNLYPLYFFKLDILNGQRA